MEPGFDEVGLVQATGVPGGGIRQAVRLCFRFTLSLRDVEALLSELGIEVSDGTLRCWTIKF